jgi:hypothetical protein
MFYTNINVWHNYLWRSSALQPTDNFFVTEYKQKIMSIPSENFNYVQYVTVYVECPNIAVPKGKWLTTAPNLKWTAKCWLVYMDWFTVTCDTQQE